jgi:hypothetical protein
MKLITMNCSASLKAEEHTLLLAVADMSHSRDMRHSWSATVFIIRTF